VTTMQDKALGKLTPDDMMSCSRLPALLGFSKFRTPNDELKYSINAINGEVNEFVEQEPMLWGNLTEKLILAEACKRLGVDIDQLAHDKPYFHPDIPLATSLDGTASGNDTTIYTDIDKGIYVMGQDSIKLDGYGILEAKLTAQEVETEPAPYRGVIQLQGQMNIMKASWGALCVLYKGTTLRIFLYPINEDHVNMIHNAVEDFQMRLDKYKTNQEIEWYPLSDSFEASRVFDRAEKSTIEMPEIEIQAEKIIELREKIMELETAIDKLQINIMEQMRDAEVCNAGRYKISWPMRQYKAQPAKTVPAKEAYVIRQSKLSIKDRI
jgi:predicted phage-related endonuclease